MDVMKYKSSIIVFLLFGVLVFGAFYPRVNFKERESMILHAVMNFLDQAHFTPKAVDDEFSKKVFKNYLKSIDGAKRFLTQKEVDQLKPFELLIDDEANARTFEFFDLSVDLLEKGVDNAQTHYESWIQKDFDFSKSETIEFDFDKKSFATDDAGLSEYWRKAVKYEMLSRIYDITQDQNEKKPEVLLSKKEIEDKAREGTKNMYDNWFKSMSKLRRSDRFEAYLNAITHRYDPHSDYFNPKEKQDFDINMGGKLEGIGARLRTDGDYTKVVEIIPGGPAWKGKHLEVNDLITKVTQKGDVAVDISGMRIDDVVQKIRGKKGTTVILSVKKADGEMADVEITRDIVNIEETFAKSLILDIPDVMDNVGYIKLPKFYSSFERKDGNSCAEDVANEIEKLKAAGINGMILDLRFNGGGSLRDVVDMTGLFIEEGPIVQVKSRERESYVYKDKDPKVRYDGPLVVMVNSYSASASEILAAALQDYDRAIIVGSSSTFGKGTVQRFFDLDDAIRGGTEFKPLGQVKMTMQKFYRVDGGSTQLKGVEPDIVLPDSYSFLKTGEKEYDDPMEWTKIEPVKFDQNAYIVNNRQALRSKSNTRVQANSDFQLIIENAKRLKEVRDYTTFPLDQSGFETLMQVRESDADRFEKIMESSITDFEVKNLKVDFEKISIDGATMEKNQDWIDGVQKDIYLEEVLHILKDMSKS